jgi:hypothetical protein
MNNKQRQSLKKIQSDIDRLWNRVEAIKEAEDSKDRLSNGTSSLRHARPSKFVRPAMSLPVLRTSWLKHRRKLSHSPTAGINAPIQPNNPHKQTMKITMRIAFYGRE